MLLFISEFSVNCFSFFSKYRDIYVSVSGNNTSHYRCISKRVGGKMLVYSFTCQMYQHLNQTKYKLKGFHSDHASYMKI